MPFSCLFVAIRHPATARIENRFADFAPRAIKSNMNPPEIPILFIL